MSSDKGRRKFLKYGIIGAVVAVVAGVGGFAAWQATRPLPTLTLKISHQWPEPVEDEGDVRALYLEKFARRMEEETDGTLRFEIYPSQSLSKATEQFEAMSSGDIDISFYPLNYVAENIPLLAIVDMPCIVRDHEQGRKWRTSEVGDKVRMLTEEKGVKVLDMVWESGNFASKPHPIILPSDIKDLKMRAISESDAAAFKAAGASTTLMSSAEIYDSLRNGVIDAAPTTDASFTSYRIFEVTKYFNSAANYGWLWALEGPCISSRTWTKLTSDQQQAMLKVVDELKPFIDQGSEDASFEAAKIFEDAGCEVHVMNQDEYNEWLSLAQETAWKEFTNTVQGAAELIDLALKI